MATASELRSKTSDELKKTLVGLKKEQFNLRFQKANMALENTSSMKSVRKEIARIKTVMTEVVAKESAGKGEA